MTIIDVVYIPRRSGIGTCICSAHRHVESFHAQQYYEPEAITSVNVCAYCYLLEYYSDSNNVFDYLD